MPGSIELGTGKGKTVVPPSNLKHEAGNGDMNLAEEKQHYVKERCRSEEANNSNSEKRSCSSTPETEVRNQLLKSVKQEQPEESEMKSFAQNTMNELLGLYGYDRLAENDLGRYRLQAGISSQRNRYSADSSSDVSPQPSDREDKSRPSVLNLKTHTASPPPRSTRESAFSSSKRAKVFETGISLPRNVGDRSHSGRKPLNTPPHPKISLASPIRGYDEEVTCSWCRKQGRSLFTLQENDGTKSFCSEKCFAACRRATFKRTRVCDWCKQIRHPRKFLENTGGDGRLQFCSSQCLEGYKMAIFCKEIQNGKSEDEKDDVSNTSSGRGLISPPTDDESGLVDLRMRSPSIKIRHALLTTSLDNPNTSSNRTKSISPDGVFTLDPNPIRPKRFSRDDTSSGVTSSPRNNDAESRRFSSTETNHRSHSKESHNRFRHSDSSLRKAQKSRSSNDVRPVVHKPKAGVQSQRTQASPTLKKTVRTAWPPVGGTPKHLPPLSTTHEALTNMGVGKTLNPNPLPVPFFGEQSPMNVAALQSMLASGLLQNQLPPNPNLYPGLYPGFPFNPQLPSLPKENSEKLDPSSFFLGLMAAGNSLPNPGALPAVGEPHKPQQSAQITPSYSNTPEVSKPSTVEVQQKPQPITNNNTSPFPYPMLLVPFPVPVPIPIPIPMPRPDTESKDLNQEIETTKSDSLKESATQPTNQPSQPAGLETAERTLSPKPESQKSPSNESEPFDSSAIDLSTRKRESSEETSRKRSADDVACVPDRPMVVANKKPKILA
nr:sine oculis-binding protein homolog [Ciona intestinalis]|eukprot:XP_009860569.1 sine oculis-binding protein homolog [Ciona intestinalis]